MSKPARPVALARAATPWFVLGATLLAVTFPAWRVAMPGWRPTIAELLTVRCLSAPF